MCASLGWSVERIGRYLLEDQQINGSVEESRGVLLKIVQCIYRSNSGRKMLNKNYFPYQQCADILRFSKLLDYGLSRCVVERRIPNNQHDSKARTITLSCIAITYHNIYPEET